MKTNFAGIYKYVKGLNQEQATGLLVFLAGFLQGQAFEDFADGCKTFAASDQEGKVE